MAKYEIQSDAYAAYDMTAESTLTDLQSVAKSLATAIGKPKKFVPGFLVAAMRMLHQSGNSTPLMQFMAHADLKTEQLAARYIGALAGVDNKGKPRVTWKKSEGKFRWGSWRNDGTINESVAAILMAAHGVTQFDDPALVKKVFPKREKPVDYEKKLNTIKAQFAKVVEESDIDAADLLHMLKMMQDKVRESTRQTPQLAGAAAVPTLTDDDAVNIPGINEAVNH